MLADHRSETERLNEIYDMCAVGEMDRPSYQHAMATARARLDSLDAEVQALNGQLPAQRLLHASPRFREGWKEADISWRRRGIALLIKKAVITPATRRGMTKAQRFAGRRVFRPEDVEIRWTA